MRETAADLADRAAPLTLYAALCVLSALVSLAALVGLVGSNPRTSDAVLDVVRDIRNTPDGGVFKGPVEDVMRDTQLAVLLLLAGLAATAGTTALYLRSLRRVTQQFTGTQDSTVELPGGVRALARVVVAMLIVLAGLGVLVTGVLAHAIGDATALSEEAVVSWDIVKWPLLFVMAFAGFAALHRSAFSDPRVLSDSAITSSQAVAALAWAFAITGFALYLAGFDTFENTYGTIGSGIVLLVWVTMFTMLYYVAPDFRVSGAKALGAGAALSTVTWLAAGGVLAACVVALAPLDGGPATLGLGIAFLAALWVTNISVLLGVRLNAPGTVWPGTAPAVSGSPALDGHARSNSHAEELVRVVGRALQNDIAHDGMLSPIAHAEEETARLSDLELDLGDWSFTYGVAWSEARAADPSASDEQVAERALAAAREVFGLYSGLPDWEDHIRRQIMSRRPQHDIVADHLEETFGNGRRDYGLLR